MNTNYIQGDMTDVPAKKEALVTSVLLLLTRDIIFLHAVVLNLE